MSKSSPLAPLSIPTNRYTIKEGHTPHRHLPRIREGKLETNYIPPEIEEV